MKNYRHKWKYEDHERPQECCYDCRMRYNEFPDMMIPNHLWELINPTHHKDAGLLCPTCVANRLNYIDKWYENDLFLLELYENNNLIERRDNQMGSLLLNMNIKITEVDEVMDIVKCSIGLTDQVEMSEFIDESGHKLTMNEAYVKLKESIHRFNNLLANCNDYKFVDKDEN